MALFAFEVSTFEPSKLISTIARHFPDNPRVQYVDLKDAIDLRDTNIVFDGMHLNAEGNGIIAQGLVEPVRGLAAIREGMSRP